MRKNELMKRYYKPFTNLKNLQKSEGFLFLYFFIEHNGLRLCVRFFALSECSILAQFLKAKTDAKPLL